MGKIPIGELFLRSGFNQKADTRTTPVEDYFDAFREEYSEDIAPDYNLDPQDIWNTAQRGMASFTLEESSIRAQRTQEGPLARALRELRLHVESHHLRF